MEHYSHLEISEAFVQALRTFPTQDAIEHCGASIIVSPFEFHATCGQCGSKIKVRSFSSGDEIEDLFDAFFEWLNQPGASEVAEQRQSVIEQNS